MRGCSIVLIFIGSLSALVCLGRLNIAVVGKDTMTKEEEVRRMVDWRRVTM